MQTITPIRDDSAKEWISNKQGTGREHSRVILAEFEHWLAVASDVDKLSNATWSTSRRFGEMLVKQGFDEDVVREYLDTLKRFYRWLDGDRDEWSPEDGETTSIPFSWHDRHANADVVDLWFDKHRD